MFSIQASAVSCARGGSARCGPGAAEDSGGVVRSPDHHSHGSVPLSPVPAPDTPIPLDTLYYTLGHHEPLRQLGRVQYPLQGGQRRRRGHHLRQRHRPQPRLRQTQVRGIH